jgi:hypothetical protein
MPDVERRRAALYWADILEGEIHRYHLPTAEHTVLSFHEEVGCFALREQGGFIVAMRTGIWLTDKHGLLRRKVCDNPSNPQLARFNDGGTDLWAILCGHVLGAGRLQRRPADAHRQRPDAESDPVRYSRAQRLSV